MNTTLLDPPEADAGPASAPPRLLTIKQFARLPDSHVYELIDGVVVRRGMSTRSSEVTVNCIELLAPYVRRQKLGRFFDPQGGYIFFDGRATVRYPDASFIRADRLPASRPSFWRLAPDFAFESVSPTDKGEAVVAKVEMYLRVGVRLVWVAYPVAQVVHAFRPDGTVERFAEGATLKAEGLFPGWSAPAAELFAGA